MSETFRATPPEQQWSGSGSGHMGSAFGPPPGGENDADNEIGRALLVGVLGGMLSAVGYLIYRRLPDEQKERLHAQVRAQVQQRINDLRQNFNF